MFQTSNKLDLFELHDAEILSIDIGSEEITLELSFAFLSALHEANPFEKAQTIKPCTIKFHGVSNNTAKMWNEKKRIYEAHAEPQRPLQNEIMEFEVTEHHHENHIKISGHHLAGWTEWSFVCTTYLVSWAEFAGTAWYENK